MSEQSAESVVCLGSGDYPAENVILDTGPWEPSGTCRVCGRSMTLRGFRLPIHNDGSEDLFGDVNEPVPDNPQHCFNCGNDLPCPAHSDGSTEGPER